jgi:hypothetical protein
MKEITTINAVIMKAVADKEFRQKLDSNPAETLKEAGVKLKDNVTVKIYYDKKDVPDENNKHEMPLLFPSAELQNEIIEIIESKKKKDKEDIEDDDLESVSGGSGGADHGMTEDEEFWMDLAANTASVAVATLGVVAIVGTAPVSVPVLAGLGVAAAAGPAMEFAYDHFLYTDHDAPNTEEIQNYMDDVVENSGHLEYDPDGNIIDTNYPGVDWEAEAENTNQEMNDIAEQEGGDVPSTEDHYNQNPEDDPNNQAPQ